MPEPDPGRGHRAPAGSIDRRRLLKTAGIAGAALWVTPAVLALDASPAAASSCSCGGETTTHQFLTLRTAVPGTPTTQTKEGTGTLATFCRPDSTQAVYLWGTDNPLGGSTYGPMFDDIGIVTVTENRTGGVTRYGNIYRFQNFSRHGTNVPTNLLAGYSAAVQRVYTGLDVNTWDYLPPQPAGTAPQTVDPGTWTTNSAPAGGNPNATTSVGNPGFTNPAPTWPGKIDISLLFGSGCGSFTVTVDDWNRYQEYKWSNIFIGTTPPPGS